MIVFNNFRLTDISGVKVVGVNRPIAPTINNKLKESGSSDGVYDFGKKMSSKIITVRLVVSGVDLAGVQTTLQTLADMLITDTACKLQFDDMPNKYYMARVTNIGVPSQEYLVTEVNVEFTCAYPYLLGNAKQVTLAGDTGAITVSGALGCMPTITVSFKASASYLQINNGSQYIKINRSFVNGDAVTINCGTGAVLLNGARIAQYLDWQNSTFFSLDVGTNNLSVTPVNVSTTTINYNERWY